MPIKWQGRKKDINSQEQRNGKGKERMGKMRDQIYKDIVTRQIWRYFLYRRTQNYILHVPFLRNLLENALQQMRTQNRKENMACRGQKLWPIGDLKGLGWLLGSPLQDPIQTGARKGERDQETNGTGWVFRAMSGSLKTLFLACDRSVRRVGGFFQKTSF